MQQRIRNYISHKISKFPLTKNIPHKVKFSRRGSSPDEEFPPPRETTVEGRRNDDAAVDVIAIFIAVQQYVRVCVRMFERLCGVFQEFFAQ